MKTRISEKVLRRIWKTQNFINTPLITSNGQTIKVINPGKSNPDGGPDFLNAKIYIGDTLYSGDIEIHMSPTDWKTHQHYDNPKYDRVILHIAYKQPNDTQKYEIRTKSNRIVPVLFLQQFINESIIERAYEDIFKEPVTEFSHLKCRQKNEIISGDSLREWLVKLSIERLEYKIRRMDERLKELISYDKLREPIIKYEGEIYNIKIEDIPNFEPEYDTKDFTEKRYWEQLFYENIFEALGYSKNISPFLKLSRLVTLENFKNLELPKSKTQRIAVIESILFVYSGLIPETNLVKDKETRDYIDNLKKNFENFKLTITSQNIKSAEWQFFRLRPKNFPTLRIAGAAHLVDKIIYDSLFKNILNIILDSTISVNEKLKHLIKNFEVTSYNYWKTHYRFGNKSEKEIKVLIGKEKIIEIIINVVIPICLLYARIFKKRALREYTLALYQHIKISHKKFLITRMDEELIHEKIKVNDAVIYQGLIQLYKFYCIENRCKECEVYKSIEAIN